MAIEITVSAKRYEDSDNCLAAAAADVAKQHGYEGWDLDARWTSGQRTHIAVTMPRSYEPEIDDDEIETMMAAAGAHGDSGMVETCRRALAGDKEARHEVAITLVDAKAMA